MSSSDVAGGMYLTLLLVHGDEIISDSKVENGYMAACAKFKVRRCKLNHL
jgi:hypothetical protein